ncbi:MAG: hypothetical protein O9289_18300 [Rhodobacteraceae bacterium]|nr:hypothetical protein [Paracoccaceae bacterium]
MGEVEIDGDGNGYGAGADEDQRAHFAQERAWFGARQKVMPVLVFL